VGRSGRHRFRVIRRRARAASAALIMGSGLCITAAAQAQDTSIKHGGFVEGGHTGVSQGRSDTDGFYGVASYYFQEVRHGALPHSQAAFLERASSVTLAAGDLSGNYPFIGRRGVDVRAIDLEYINTSHWILGASYKSLEVDSVSETDTTAIRLGRYLGDASRILVSVSDADTTNVLTGEESDSKLYGLEYKNVTVMVDGQAITLDMKYNHQDSDLGNSNQLSLGGEYHFSLATSVTLQANHSWGQLDGEGYAFGLNHYLTPFFALGANYSKGNTTRQPTSHTVSTYFRLLF